MKLIAILFVISFFSFGCSTISKMGESIDRSLSHDGLTSKERSEKNERFWADAEEKRIAKEKEDEEKLQACIKFSNDNQYSDMKRFETCNPPHRKGLAKNSIATFYFWYDGREPHYAYFDKEGRLLIMEKDQETIDNRRAEYKRDRETADSQYMQRLQIYNANQNAQNLNNTIRKQNCIRNSRANTAMYCN